MASIVSGGKRRAFYRDEPMKARMSPHDWAALPSFILSNNAKKWIRFLPERRTASEVRLAVTHDLSRSER